LRLNAGSTISIASPEDGAVVSGSDLNVTADVQRFELIDALGDPNVAGQGHIHYFLDVDPPTTPGVPAIPSEGAYAATANPWHVWTDLSPGEHTLSVELVNNDHTPLVPAIVDTISIEVVLAQPGLAITSPAEDSLVFGHNVTISVSVDDFDLVDNLGGVNVAGEGHIHYFRDVLPPTAPGVPAITAAGTYAPVVGTSFTWINVSVGTHMFSAELVNNDHTPLVPYVVAFVNVTVRNESGPVTIYLSASDFAFNRSTITVPAGSNVTMIFENLDAGFPHNFALYTDSSAMTLIFRGVLITGVATTTYSFEAPGVPGNYYFRCDAHPTTMIGTFVAS
jgi:plastocyanin